MKLRLDRWLAMLGLGSRSQVKEWIRAGQIAAEGRVIRDPSACFESESCALTAFGNPVDGRVVRHVMLYKPAGLLTAARDAKQPTVMDLLPAVYRGIGCMPVGRLDKDTTGLLLLTCDGEMNHRLLSPARHVEKRYRAETEGCLGPGDAERVAAGLDLGDFTARPARLEILSASESGSAAEVTVTEGKFHQVKRMFSAVGHEVITLHRCSFGPLELDPALTPGAWRELREEELRLLRQAAGMNEEEA